ncbi:nuclease EXOG, mitochondrial-like [Lampris incognitus]|uniref:nuclease EXOG, mitochondrial-like n=1 Tax=Lampris incognitus TaxID=2546036 RepID=UPI0024B4A564|nr:nuclease EXOG, mitochondrial-like [Lampris incognitus]
MRLFGFFGGFFCGAAVSTGSCVTALKLYQLETGQEQKGTSEKVPEVREDIGRFGFPVTGAEVRHYANHTLSYDQSKRTPRWVAEHLTNHKLQGNTERKHCRFRPDPAIPACFSATNGDYFRSGWSRGHMAPAGDNKQSERFMADTFLLSNIVPQNYENNAGFWNRLEMYCRDLTKRFQDVWVVSGPLVLPQEVDGKRKVSYQVIGNDGVAVPTHLFKVILVQNNNVSDKAEQSQSPPLALGAFIIPNQPISFERSLTDFQVSLLELEKAAGLTFYPRLPKTSDPASETAGGNSKTRTEQEIKSNNKEVNLNTEQSAADSIPTEFGPPTDLCKVDGCKLMGYKEFTLYLTGRKVGSARSIEKLEKFMSELKDQGIQPDDYLTNLYQQKKEELANKEPPKGKTGV